MTINLERSPIATSPISAVVPANQAAGEITAALEGLLSELDKLKRTCEVLVIDDASTDGTAAKVEELAQRFGQVRLLRNETPQGYGATLSRGFAGAQHPLVFTCPADGSCGPGALGAMLANIDQVDIVCGVRKPRPAGQTGVRWGASLFFGLSLQDVACPMRLYRKSIFERLPIQSKGAFADVEILAKANFMECLMAEVDVECKPGMPNRWAAVSGDGRRLFMHPRFGAPATNAPAAS